MDRVASLGSERCKVMRLTVKQMVQQAVDNGTMTADQAAQMNEHMQQMAPVMQQMMQGGGMMGNFNSNNK